MSWRHQIAQHSPMMATFSVAVLSLFLSLGLGHFAQANVFSPDDREPVAVSVHHPLAAVGQLTHLRDGSQGTGFLVSACHVLTNFHVAFADETRPSVDSLNETLEFRTSAGSVSKARPVLHGSFIPDANDTDWALLRLETCLGRAPRSCDGLKPASCPQNRSEWLELDQISLEEAAALDGRLQMAGYPSDRSADHLTLDPSCGVKRETLQESGGWRHDCATREGNSGGPIFFLSPDGRPRVIALGVTERGGFQELIRGYDVLVSNGAVPVSSFLDKIRPILRADR